VFSARNLAQLDDTLTATDVRLTEDQRNFLTE
jgi:aryl-alcohol dehydrogenase-like predicted oxidoreductase